MLKRPFLHNTLGSGLAYGLGLLLGSALELLFIANVSFAPDRDQESDFNFLLAGVLLAFLITALAGGIGGFIGGWSLPDAEGVRGRWGYAWQGAISMAVPNGLFLFITLFIISYFSFYGAAGVSPTRFILLFALTGAFYGVLIGLILGILTVGWWRSGRIVLYSLAGFGLGGIGYGIGLREYLFSVSEGDLATGQFPFLALGIVVLGFLGGSALGMVYSWMAEKSLPSHQPNKFRPVALITLAVLVILLLLSLQALSPFLARLSAVLTPRSADLSTTLSSDTTGTHWSDPVTVASIEGESVQVALATMDDQVALVWKQDSGGLSATMYRPGRWNEVIQKTEWYAPLTVDQSVGQQSEPQVTLDKDGFAHIVWRDGSVVFYSSCQLDECTAPAALSEELLPSCDGAQTFTFDVSEQPAALAISQDNRLMAVWHGQDGGLLYTSGRTSLSPGTGGSNCISTGATGSATQIKLAGGPDGQFTLVYVDDQPGSEILALNYDGSSWGKSAQSIGRGHRPQVLVNNDGQRHFTWCGEDNLVKYWQAGGVETVAELSCQNRPELAMDSDENLHVTWFSDEVTRATGTSVKQPLVYESVQKGIDWTEPVIVARLEKAVQPVMASSNDGILHQVWSDDLLEQPGLVYVNQVQYACDDSTLPRVAQGALAVAQQPQYRPEGDIVPYCQNRFDQLMYTPGPAPAFSDQVPTPNGGFDALAELIRSAEYEALISTMEYSEDLNDDSPGSVVAEAVADLYEQLKSDPSRYPRGLTVRILLGNRPPLGELELNALLWHLLSDLRDAGVPEMVNPDLGWRLEVANYEGAWPHSHAKIAVIDGKTLVAAGFNMEYHHLASDHSSGLGKGTADAAIQVTGPVAQDGRRAFDELWQGATQRHCPNLFPGDSDQLWWQTCRDTKAKSDHVPEVKRYYLPGGESIAFSLLRTEAYGEADQQVTEALAAAEERIDVIHTMFTLPSICILNYLLNVCSASQAMPYMQSILDAVEQNQAKARLLIDLEPIKGIENALALGVLQAEVNARGLSDRVEIRPFPGPVHAKDTLIDDEFLIVGSHNFHWSAWGEGQGLAEYSLGVADPQAISEFERYFEYYWVRAANE